MRYKDFQHIKQHENIVYIYINYELWPYNPGLDQLPLINHFYIYLSNKSLGVMILSESGPAYATVTVSTNACDTAAANRAV